MNTKPKKYEYEVRQEAKTWFHDAYVNKDVPRSYLDVIVSFYEAGVIDNYFGLKNNPSTIDGILNNLEGKKLDMAHDVIEDLMISLYDEGYLGE